MLNYFTRRRRLVVLLAGLSVIALVLVGRWLNATKIGGQQPAEPFRIAGNFYCVGANDVAAFLITGPEGHVVLDAGYPTTALMITDSIAKLGFSIQDVKVLLNSEPHSDHAGGLAVWCCSPCFRLRAPTGSGARPAVRGMSGLTGAGYTARSGRLSS